MLCVMPTALGTQPRRPKWSSKSAVLKESNQWLALTFCFLFFTPIIIVFLLSYFVDTKHPVSNTPGEQQAQQCVGELRLARDDFDAV